MKAISLKTLVFLALAANMALYSCKKKDDPTPTSTTNNSSSNNGATTNAITFVSKTDTIWTGAADSSSRSFLNGNDTVYTATQIGTKKMGSTVVLGYFYNQNSTYAASITDAYAYPVGYSWTNLSTVTNFKTITMDSSTFSGLSQASVQAAYTGSSAQATSAVYNVIQGQVIAFLTGTGNYGVLRVNNIVTTMGTNGIPNPYTTYLVYSLKMEL